MKRFLFPKLGLAGLLMIVLVSSSPVRAEGPEVPPKGWTDGYVMANGIRIHYWRTGGEKPLLLMLHGFSDDGLCWTDLAKELQADYDIVMTDARGHGLSDPPTASDPTDAQVEDIAGVIRELDLKNPIIMGHSMGSASAAWFAAKYPDVPRAVILEDPGLVPRPPRNSSGSSEAQQQRAMAQILARNNTPYEELLAECMRNSPGWSRSECEYWARSKRLYHPGLALRSAGERPDIADLFEKITAPTLILKADAEGDDRVKNEQVAGILKNGRIVHIEGAGHCVHRDRMSRSLAVLREFLSDVK
jgi:pimeloyl-ACP methyl ester carboxylesterase